MNLRLPLHVIARQHGLLITPEALAASLHNGQSPALFRMADNPTSEILPNGCEVTITQDAPQGDCGRVVRL